MIPFKIALSKQQKQRLQNKKNQADLEKDCQQATRYFALLCFDKIQCVSEVANLLQITQETVRTWIKLYLLQGIRGLIKNTSPGRPSKLNDDEKKQLKKWLQQSPETFGFTSSCWHTPVIQTLIEEKFNVSFNANYLSAFLKSLGFSYQKAKFVASKQDKQARALWLDEQWPIILKQAEKKGAYLLFGDEASFPQWGTLSYTWALKGKQPVVKTSGTRRSYKVFGLIDYFTGKFFSKGHEGKLNGDSYITFLKEVMGKTKKHLVLIEDGAPYHRSKKVKAFFKKNKKRLTVFKLPSYSPDFNPIEMLWKKIKAQGTHMKYFPTFDDLKEKVNEMLDVFKEAKHEVLSLFGLYEKLA